MGDTPEDRLIYRTAPSRLIFFHYYLLIVILAGLSAGMSLGYLQFDLPDIAGFDLDLYVPLAAAVLALLLFFYAELKRMLRRYMVFENRVARREGILSKRIQYMPYNKVERLELNQSIIKRIFGIGDLHIDTGEDKMIFQAIRRPANVERLVSERLVAADIFTRKAAGTGEPP